MTSRTAPNRLRVMQTAQAAMFPAESLAPFAPGIQWAVLPGDGMTLVYWIFEPPQCGEVPMHRHPVAQGGVILEGSIEMRYGDGTVTRLRAGDFYTIGANVEHGAAFSERCVALDVFTPNRREYEERYAARTVGERFVVDGGSG